MNHGVGGGGDPQQRWQPPGAGRQRWDRLFDDLQAQLDRDEVAERSAERAEHTRAVRGEARLLDRLAGSAGDLLRVHLRGHGIVEGVVVTLGADWFVLHGSPGSAIAQGSGRAWLVPDSAVTGIWGLSARIDPHEGLSRRRLDIRHAIRAISRDRAVVRVATVDGGQSTGTIDRVGRDHLDLSEHPEDLPRRSHAVRATVVIPVSAISSVVSAASVRERRG